MSRIRLRLAQTFDAKPGTRVEVVSRPLPGTIIAAEWAPDLLRQLRAALRESK